jgi:hypothetical protein
MLNARLMARWALLGTLLLITMWIGYVAWRKPASHPPQTRHLPDGTIAALQADTRLVTAAGFPSPREISLDGWALLKVPAAPQALIVRTHLMRLEVRGPSTLAITARSQESGEQVEVLDGEVIVSKNYSSSYRVPDDLHGGEMSMVNVTIDLMEKESIDAQSRERLRKRASALR